jgi:hypothetical protein
VWTTLAQATNNKQKQLSAYQKAVESLETIPLAQVEYLILYGEFLYSAGYPVEDAKNQLIAAADILLELDTALEDEENASHAVSTIVSNREARFIEGGGVKDRMGGSSDTLQNPRPQEP